MSIKAVETPVEKRSWQCGAGRAVEQAKGASIKQTVPQALPLASGGASSATWPVIAPPTTPPKPPDSSDQPGPGSSSSDQPRSSSSDQPGSSSSDAPLGRLEGCTCCLGEHVDDEYDFYGRPVWPPRPKDPSPPRKIYWHPKHGKVVGQRYPWGVKYEKPHGSIE